MKEVAAKLGISTRTAESHKYEIMSTRKLVARALVLLLFTLFFSTLDAQTTTNSTPQLQHALMPVPASIAFQSGRLRIKDAFAVAFKDVSDSRLPSAIERALLRLQGRTGLTLSRQPVADENAATIVIRCAAAGESMPSLAADESYGLEVNERQAMLTAPTVVGAMRGLETILQLVSSDSDGFYLPAVSIQDRPRFRWRGLLIDVGRHYEPVEVLKRNIDGMAAVKLNVFHWHLSEDQGFRIESKKFPKLHTLGSDGLFYTQDQARDIIEYARQRGIRVVPEFDIPGHSTSWLVGYPELGSAPGPYTIERRAGIFEPALDPTREDVYKFLDGFLGEMAALFPDAYMHIGGDENEGKQWDRNPKIQAFMKQKGISSNHALQAYFNQRLMKILEKHKKKMIGWDEILQPGLPNNAVIQSWRGTAALADAARKGYDGILSNGYYIDLSYSTSQHYIADPLPADTTLTAEEAKHILGGEATMWGEWVSPETIDSRIWPRTAAIAERLWSPQSITDIDDMYRRLAVVSLQLEELGLTHERNVRVILRRLVGNKEVGPLSQLVSLVEPVKEYRRGQQRPATMLSPLSGFVDAARPDSEAARSFAKLVDSLISDAPGFQTSAGELRTTLTSWQGAQPAMISLIDSSPALKETRPLAIDLLNMSTAGLEALSYLSTGTEPAAGWREAKLMVLDEAAKPKAAVEFPAVRSVRILVIAASHLADAKSMSPADWKKKVLEEAAGPKK